MLGNLVVGGCLFAQTWKPLNQGLPKQVSGVSQIAVSTDGTVAYAISSLGGLLRQSDQSGKWKQVDGLVGVGALALAAGPNPMVYAATNAGIRISSDNGKTWKNAGSANARVAGIQSIAVDPGDAETAYTVANAPEATPGVLAGSQVLKTTDGGETWATISSFSSQDGVTTVSLDPVNPSTLYASSFSGGIFKTVDGGRTWTAIKAGLIDTGFGDVVRLAVDPKNPSTLYAGSFVAFTDPGGPDQPGFGTISKSLDGGQTWTTIRTGIPAGAFVEPPVIDPANSSVLYAGFEAGLEGSGEGVLKSTDGGESWSQVYATSGVEVNVSAGSGILYAAQETSGGGAGGIAASTNGGQNWTNSNQGLSYFNLETLVLDPYDPDEVYAGGSSGLFRKSKGTDFTSLPVPAPVDPYDPEALQGGTLVSLAIDPANPQVWYASTSFSNGCVYYNQLLFKSADGGNTWSSVSPQDSGCLTNAPMLVGPQSQIVYLAENDYIDDGYNLLKSADGGVTWNSIWSSGASAVSFLVADPAVTNAGTLYAGLLGYSGDPSGLFKSIDGGTTWNAARLANIGVTALALDPTDSNTLFASSSQSVYKSTDGGVTWMPVSQGLSQVGTVGASITALAIDPENHTIVYASTSGAGIYMTPDAGNSWVSFNAGLTTLNIRSLAASAVDRQSVYALTTDGVFKLTKP